MQSIIKKSNLKKSLRFFPILILAYIIYDLALNKNLHFSFDFLLQQKWSLIRLSIFFPIFILMLINWLLESKKWQLLTKDYHRLSLKESFLSVLSGISTALFTPNRIGDFIGRVSHLPNEHRKKGMISSFYGSFSQWLLTIIMGWIAWLQLGSKLVESQSLFVLISLFYFIIAGALLLLFLSGKVSLFKFVKNKLNFDNPPSTTIRIKLILFSFLRYLIFTTQFYLLFRLLGLNLDYALVLSKLGLFYLLTSLVPSTFWGELGIKESVAVWVFSGIVFNSLLIVCATLLLWFINLLVPAIAGNYFLYKKVREIPL